MNPADWPRKWADYETKNERAREDYERLLTKFKHHPPPPRHFDVQTVRGIYGHFRVANRRVA